MSDRHLDRARAFLERLARGDAAEAWGAFDETMRAAMPLAALERTWLAVTSQVGPLSGVRSARTEAAGGHTIVFLTSAFAKAELDVKVVLDADGAIAGLFFVPSATPYTPPSYADLARVVTSEVVVGEGPWALPGTLTLPVDAAEVPAVVLVHGSGPSDRDETIGACKPFRDLALGLATLGIGVLTYDKRTRVHAARLAAVLDTFTVVEETVEDASLAVDLLRRQAGIDPSRVFVAGHSLGGNLAPRIAQRAPEVRGLAILAGSTRTVPAMMLEQLRYLAGLDATAATVLAPQIVAVEAAAARIAAVAAGAEPRPGEVLLGAGAAYWRDLAGYDALAVVRTLPQPVFVAQGGRDYQVTDVDFAAWKAALEGRPTATLVHYPSLNHALCAGVGPSRPEEYHQRAEVDAALVRDLAGWIARV